MQASDNEGENDGDSARLVPRGFFAGDDDWRLFRQQVQARVPKKAKAQAGRGAWRWVLYAVLILGAVLVVVLAGR